MIITITDHYQDAIEKLAGSDLESTTLRQRLTHDDCQQPAAFVVVDRATMTQIVNELAARGVLSITEGAC